MELVIKQTEGKPVRIDSATKISVTLDGEDMKRFSIEQIVDDALGDAIKVRAPARTPLLVRPSKNTLEMG